MYKKPPFKGPWLTIEEAAQKLGFDEKGFVRFACESSMDIPKRYADMPDGDHSRSGDLLISPLAMISLFLLRGMPEKAQELVSKVKAVRPQMAVLQ